MNAPWLNIWSSLRWILWFIIIFSLKLLRYLMQQFTPSWPAVTWQKNQQVFGWSADFVNEKLVCKGWKNTLLYVYIIYFFVKSTIKEMQRQKKMIYAIIVILYYRNNMFVSASLLVAMVALFPRRCRTLCCSEQWQWLQGDSSEKHPLGLWQLIPDNTHLIRHHLLYYVSCSVRQLYSKPLTFTRLMRYEVTTGRIENRNLM